MFAGPEALLTVNTGNIRVISRSVIVDLPIMFDKVLKQKEDVLKSHELT